MSYHISKKEAKILGLSVDNRPASSQTKDEFVPTLTKAEEEAYREEAKRNAVFSLMQKGNR